VGFVVDKVASAQVFSEYFGFPCHRPFHSTNFIIIVIIIIIITVTRGKHAEALRRNHPSKESSRLS
jgi:hypothetical protein